MRPTSVIFGGEDLGTLYITSMRHGVPPEELAGDAPHGALFAARPGVRGLPEPAFAG